MPEGKATDVENGGNFWSQDLVCCFYWSVIINVTFAPSNNWNVALFSHGSTAFHVKNRRLNVRSNLKHWKKKWHFHHFARGGGALQPFFSTTLLINGQKFVTENIRWNKCALTWVKSFHNQNCCERIPSNAKRTRIARVTFDTLTYVNHITRTN